MKVLLYPLATEKAINMIDRDNVITYVVDMRAKNSEIKEEFENTFAVKVERVSTARMPQNVKKAYIKVAKKFKAGDIALKLKLV